MARDRDLKIAVVSDVDKFDLDKPADELEKVGDAADDTRKRLSNFLDKAASESSKLRKLDDEAGRAKRGLDDLKDEAGSTGREAAASFSGGFDDITGAIQETAANAFAGFGPLGAAAGLAAAAGIGFVVNSINESKERVKELTETFLDLRREGIDPAADAASHLAEELDAAQLSDLKRDADELGVSYKTMRDALDGNADAIRNVRKAVDEHTSGLDEALGINNYDALREKLDETEQAARNAGDGVAFLEAQTEAAKERASEMGDALAGVGEDAADMAKAIDKGADAVIEAQTRQLTAMQDFEVNAKAVLDKVGQAGVDWALSQGENAEEAMQLLANAPIAKAEQIVANYTALGTKSTEAYAAGTLGGRGAATSAAGQVRADMRAILEERIDTPVGVVPRVNYGQVREQIRQGIGAIAIDAVVRTPRGRMIQ